MKRTWLPRKQKIKSIYLTNGEYFEPCPKGEFEKEGSLTGSFKNECSIKHLGRQIYRIGYFKFSKQGYSRHGEQSRINQHIIVFPSQIERVTFE